jgi:hypothetical protein
MPATPHGDVPPPRWVLRIANDRVLYSRGGNHHYSCLVATMKRWIKRTEATRRHAH